MPTELKSALIRDGNNFVITNQDDPRVRIVGLKATILNSASSPIGAIRILACNAETAELPHILMGLISRDSEDIAMSGFLKCCGLYRDSVFSSGREPESEDHLRLLKKNEIYNPTVRIISSLQTSAEELIKTLEQLGTASISAKARNIALRVLGMANPDFMELGAEAQNWLVRRVNFSLPPRGLDFLHSAARTYELV